MLKVSGSSLFLILDFLFLKYVYYVFILDAGFGGNFFFHFSGHCVAIKVILKCSFLKYVSCVHP